MEQLEDHFMLGNAASGKDDHFRVLALLGDRIGILHLSVRMS